MTWTRTAQQERRRSATADCCTEPRTIWKLAGGPFRGQVDSREEAQTAEVTCCGPAHFSDKQRGVEQLVQFPDGRYTEVTRWGNAERRVLLP